MLALADPTVDNEHVAGSNASDSSDFTWTEEEEKAVRWKLDKVIVPLTTFLYLLCFLDRYDGCPLCMVMSKDHHHLVPR